MNFDRQKGFRGQPMSGVIESVVRQGHEWRVRVSGVYWSAITTRPVELCPGDSVEVVGRQNLKLIISAKTS